MIEHHGHISAEIASLQRRADQLTDTNVDTERLLASLSEKVAVARSTEDASVTRRLDRQIHLVQQRLAQTCREIDTLLALIAARRARYDIPSHDIIGDSRPTLVDKG
jgi:hypothetical protein